MATGGEGLSPQPRSNCVEGPGWGSALADGGNQEKTDRGQKSRECWGQGDLPKTRPLNSK